MRGPTCLTALLLAACRFDPSGVGGGDDVVVPDADPLAPDAGPDGAPADGSPLDAAPPDAPVDLDEDDDTILDALDNCVSIPNTDQHDEDGDGDGDVCDNCPHLGNAGQDNADGDGVGDVCDPRPGEPDVIAVFEPFTGTTLPAGWTGIGGAWSVAGDELHQTSTADGSAHLYLTGESWTTMWIATRTDVDTVPPDDPGNGNEPRSAGMMVFFTQSDPVGTGFVCIVYDDVDSANDTVLLTARQAASGANSSFDFTGAIGTGDLAADQSFVMRASGGAGTIGCEVDSPTPGTLTRNDNTYTSGTVALRTNTVAASFRYVVVFVPAT